LSAWHASVIRQLQANKLFASVQLTGGKVRALLTDTLFLDIHFDPTTNSYSYAVIDMTLPYPGDKRLFGWDDFPHPDAAGLTNLSSHPHHFQERLPDGTWKFSASFFQGNVEGDVDKVVKVIRQRLR
jgi:hypothetical protein